MFLKKLLTGTIAIAAVGMLLTGCDPENPPEPGVTDPTPTEGSAPAPGGQVTEAGFIARLEDAPGPGEKDESDRERRVRTTSEYQRIYDTYGVEIISLTNPYISVDGMPETRTVNSLSSFATPENEEMVIGFANSAHPDWAYSQTNPDNISYLYYSNGILSGIYPALKYEFGENYILMDPIYNRIIDGSKQTLRSYLEEMVDDCSKDLVGLDYDIEILENDIICYEEGTSLKDALNAYCAYIDQGSSSPLHNCYGADYAFYYIYGYTGDAQMANVDSMGFNNSVDSNSSKFLNIYFYSNDEILNDTKVQGSFAEDSLVELLFRNIDTKLAECEIYPFYDRYAEDVKRYEKYGDGEEPNIEKYWTTLSNRSNIEYDGNTLQKAEYLEQRYLSKRRLEH